MKLVKPSYQIIEPTGYTVDDIYKSIELAGRVSHKSEDKITKDSAKTFVGRMLNMKHLATCEFGTVYLTYIYNPEERESRKFISKYLQNPNSKIASKVLEWKNSIKPLHEQKIGEDLGAIKIKSYITTNYRVLVENNWLDDLQYLCEPTEYHHKRYTVKFVCDRGVTHEFVRHRLFSFLQESTRYCNYSKDKFNNELTFIQPCWVNESLLKEIKGTVITKDDYGSLICEYYYHLSGKEEGWFKPWSITPEKNFVASLQIAEQLYLELLNQGWKPEQARTVLPNALKTELYMCGFAEDWKHFFELRDDKQHAHPQAYELAHPLHEEFIKRGYV